MLLDSLHIASKSINASSIAIQVAGQNLTNASTPGYVREQVLLGTSYPKTNHGTTMGTGVDVGGVVQMIDVYLEERLRNSQSDAMNTSTQSGIYSQLEFIINELTDQDLSTGLSEFFNAIGNVLNQPENLSVRQMLVDEGEKLTRLFRDTSNAILKARIDVNKSIVDLTDQINMLTEEIANLNNSIARIEAGKGPGTEAVGLRDQRIDALNKLSSLINIKTHEDESGVVSVYCGNDSLISSLGAQKLTVGYTSDPYGELSLAEIRFEVNNKALDVHSGKLNGYYEGRDQILGEFSLTLDDYAASLVVEFNAIYTSGQGLTGYDQTAGTAVIREIDEPLDQIGLVPPPKSGVFSMIVQNKETLVENTTQIQIPLSDSGAVGITMEELLAQLNEINGISARLNTSGQVEITSESPEYAFAFSGDTSGILSSLGLNTFFIGTDARTIGINSTISKDPGKIAVSQNGIGADTENGVKLAAIPETSMSKYGNKSITEAYRLSVTAVMSKAGTVQAVAVGDVSYYSSLLTQRNSVSGVNIDEETIALFNYQRVFQASSKYVSVINEMLDSLIRM